MTVSERWKKWRSRQSAIRTFNALDPGLREEIARDTAVDSSTLEALSTQGFYRNDELRALMGALSLDAARIRIAYPAVLRDMDMVCSECDMRSLCRRRLKEGSAGQTYADYCPNTQTLDALRRERRSLQLTG